VAGAEALPLPTRVALNQLGRLLSRGEWDYRPGWERDQFLTALETVVTELAPGAASPSGRGQADNKPDNRRKKSHPVPENPEVLKLAKKINRERKEGVSQIDCARELCENDERKANSLLRQLRRYPHLLE
jgi:hypothetical protein